MKIVTASNGKKTLKMSKKEWENIGKKAGWMKKSQIINDDGIADGGEPYTEDEMDLIEEEKRKNQLNFKLPPRPPNKGPERDAWKEQVVTELEQKVEELKSQGWTKEDFIRELGKMFEEGNSSSSIV